MAQPDYGPVPVSRLKDESTRIFAALGDGRRVLISRRGQVVAAIEPASIDRHAAELARFALPSEGPMAEITASDLSQGSPSERVRAAESGTPSLLTRNNKVYGVLSSVPPAPAGNARQARLDEWVAAREHALTEFEQSHPDATPAQFAAAVAAFPHPRRPPPMTPSAPSALCPACARVDHALSEAQQAFDRELSMVIRQHAHTGRGG